MLRSALSLAERGFHVFPLTENKKSPPMFANFPSIASRDANIIENWWDSRPFNIGISTTRYMDTRALLAIDVDKKNGGMESFRELNKTHEFPVTFTQVTASGGLHLLYEIPEAVRQGVHVLAQGVDTRSRGGYLVGAGSMVDGRQYICDNEPVALAPQWLIEMCSKEYSVPLMEIDPTKINRERAIELGKTYLLLAAPHAFENDGGDAVTYKVAATLKDYGLNTFDTFMLMRECWNERCNPPWSEDELKEKVNNAYKYGTSPVGVKNPEAVFADLTPEVKVAAVLSPIDEMNKQFAAITTGGDIKIIWFNDDKTLQHLKTHAFHQLMLPKKILIEGKERPLSQLWMNSEKRRTYSGFIFDPTEKNVRDKYNLWRGFAVKMPEEKLPQAAHDALEMYLDHARKNVAGGNNEQYEWIMGWMAHLIQRPQEKPLTALVLRGGKGVGKNVFVESVAHLLGNHAMVASNRRYLTGNFNSHLETTLFFILDEAFWSGDKQTEGILKDLVTGDQHIIERKFMEPYVAKNLNRIAILGNEGWLVPASQDERRYGVFDVGEGRKQDVKFFSKMIDGMKAGGYQLLFKYLKEFDLSKVNVNVAPNTKALGDQKTASLPPLEQWILDSLDGGSFTGRGWLMEIEKPALAEAFRNYTQSRRITQRLPNDIAFGLFFKKCFPNWRVSRTGRFMQRVYHIPQLAECRADFEKFLNTKIDWENDDDN